VNKLKQQSQAHIPVELQMECFLGKGVN